MARAFAWTIDIVLLAGAFCLMGFMVRLGIVGLKEGLLRTPKKTFEGSEARQMSIFYIVIGGLGLFLTIMGSIGVIGELMSR